nr:MAG TPA: hypothetical protein [Caudoviricetes sp.]
MIFFTLRLCSSQVALFVDTVSLPFLINGNHLRNLFTTIHLTCINVYYT